MPGLRLAAFAVVVSMLGGCAAPIKQTLPAESRIVSGGRNQVVTVAQNEIAAGINESNLTGAMGGGLLFALIDAGVNNARAKKAEAAIVPVRDAIVDYGFDQKALAASESLARNLDWLNIQKTELNKDPGLARFSAVLDQSPGPQLLSVTYDYQLDQNFRVLKLGANVSVLSKALPKSKKPEQRALVTNALFNRMIVVVQPLNGGVTDEMEPNAALWAKDGGRLTELALDAALGKLVVLMQKALEYTPGQAAALKKVKNVNVQGFVGRLVERDAEGTLLSNPFGQWFYVAQVK